MARFVSIGEALVEIMRPGRDQPLDRPGEFLGPFPSGAPAIFADAAARLGAEVGFVGAVGQDAFGDCILARLKGDGIDCSAVRRVPERLTGIAFVAYQGDGSRRFLFHLADSAAAMVAPEQVTEAYLADTQVLHVMGSALTFGASLRETCYRAARLVHARGGRVSFDPNLRPELMSVNEIRAICAPILHMASVILPSADEATTLTGEAHPEEAAHRLLDGGAEVVALKQGATGSMLFTRDGRLLVPAFRVEETDPTGAGDCYDAALLVALSDGMPLPEAGAFANAVGALATTRIGPMGGTCRRDEVLAFMAAQGRPLQHLE